jgi:hypothetical protein
MYAKCIHIVIICLLNNCIFIDFKVCILYAKSLRIVNIHIQILPWRYLFMPLTDVITVRLPAGKRFLYEKEAAYQGQSLSVYLRERLEKSESSSYELLKNLTLSSSSHDQGILLEILLILRYIVSPEKLNLVRGDLKRLNIPTWQGA